MHGALHKFFTDDHKRLDDLFTAATATPEACDMAAYSQFRSGLLKHITMEENILLPSLQQAKGGVASPIPPQLRLDHGASYDAFEPCQ